MTPCERHAPFLELTCDACIGAREPELVPISEAARILGVSVDTVRRWEADGRLASFRATPTAHRRFDARALRAMSEAGRTV